MKVIYNKEEVKNLINEYFEGNTSSEQEKILHDYFQQEDIDEDFKQYCSLFQAWTDLAAQSDYVEIDSSFIEEEAIFSIAKKSNRQKIIRISATAIAGVAACILLFFLTYHPQPTNSFVIINGVKYTDKTSVKNAFDASIENVRIDMEDVFSDLHGIVSEDE